MKFVEWAQVSPVLVVSERPVIPYWLCALAFPDILLLAVGKPISFGNCEQLSVFACP